MDYQVPQFVDIEDRIFGPLTIKQFIYVAGGTGIIVVIMLSLPFVIGVILSLPVAVLAGALAFSKINGKPFIEVLESGFSFYVGKRLYLWKKEKKPLTPSAVESAPVAPVPPAASVGTGLSRSKLEDLAWSLDVKSTGEPQEK